MKSITIEQATEAQIEALHALSSKYVSVSIIQIDREYALAIGVFTEEGKASIPSEIKGVKTVVSVIGDAIAF